MSLWPVVHNQKPMCDRYVFRTDADYQTYLDTREAVKAELEKHFEATTDVNPFFEAPSFKCYDNPILDMDESYWHNYRKPGTCMGYLASTGSGKEYAVEALILHKLLEFDSMVAFVESDCRKNLAMVSFMKPVNPLSDANRARFNELKKLAYEHYYWTTKTITPENQHFSITNEYEGGEDDTEPIHHITVKFHESEFKFVSKHCHGPVERTEEVVRAWEATL